MVDHGRILHRTRLCRKHFSRRRRWQCLAPRGRSSLDPPVDSSRDLCLCVMRTSSVTWSNATECNESIGLCQRSRHIVSKKLPSRQSKSGRKQCSNIGSKKVGRANRVGTEEPSCLGDRFGRRSRIPWFNDASGNRFAHPSSQKLRADVFRYQNPCIEKGVSQRSLFRTCHK